MKKIDGHTPVYRVEGEEGTAAYVWENTGPNGGYNVTLRDEEAAEMVPCAWTEIKTLAEATARADALAAGRPYKGA